MQGTVTRSRGYSCGLIRIYFRGSEQASLNEWFIRHSLDPGTSGTDTSRALTLLRV